MTVGMQSAKLKCQNCGEVIEEGSHTWPIQGGMCSAYDANGNPVPKGPKGFDADPVNHPSHYKSTSGLEVIDVIEAFKLGFRLANCIKYILRAGHKGNRQQDLEKAQWYLARELEKGP